MAHLLGAENLHIEYPTRKVFSGLTLGISEGDRIGVVGRNGDGKSTLLRLLAGDLEPDEGQVIRRSGLRVGYLPQRDNLDENITVGSAIVGDRDEYEWASDPRIRQIITGLVGDIPWEATVGTLSGGQRRRVALAALLVEDWDLLILDEPTNHLDLQGIAWLADHLNGRWTANAGGLLVVTHDRWFLDEVSRDTWEVHSGEVLPFEGGYAAYILQRVERDRQAAAIENKRQNLLRKELAWLRRGAPARTAKPKFRLDAAASLISDVPPPRDSVELTRLATGRLGKRVVNVVDASVSYGEKEIFKDVTWRIGPGERSGILGANGAGKSTLLRLIAGELEPTSGRVTRGKTVQLAVLDQQFTALNEIADDRVRDVLARTKTSFTVEGRELTPVQLLERLGFSSAHLSAYVRDLSGGQKRRLQLLMILLEEPNVLILDEPTNDVDTEMLAAMEDLLDTWPGTLLVVSHDRYLLERVTDDQYAIIGGTLRHVPGGVDEYLRLSEQSDSSQLEALEPEDAPAETSGEVSKLSGRELHEAKLELSSLERRSQRLRARVQEAQEALAEVDPANYELLADRMKEIASWEADAESFDEQWLELSTIVEDAE